MLPLLKQFFEIVASYLKPSVVKQAQQSQSMSESTIHILRRLHTIILISQGWNTLARCRHPSADPIELRTPPDLRPSVRTIVNTLEDSLACLGGGGDTSTNSPGQLMPRQHTGFNSVRGKSRWASSSRNPSPSQPQSQPTQNEWDAMDDG